MAIKRSIGPSSVDAMLAKPGGKDVRLERLVDWQVVEPVAVGGLNDLGSRDRLLNHLSCCCDWLLDHLGCGHWLLSIGRCSGWLISVGRCGRLLLAIITLLLAIVALLLTIVGSSRLLLTIIGGVGCFSEASHSVCEEINSVGHWDSSLSDGLMDESSGIAERQISLMDPGGKGLWEPSLFRIVLHSVDYILNHVRLISARIGNVSISFKNLP